MLLLLLLVCCCLPLISSGLVEVAKPSNMFSLLEMLDKKLFDLDESEVKSFEPETAKWPNVFMQHGAG